MKKIGKTEKSNNYPVRFNFPLGGGGTTIESKYDFFSMSGTPLSKYGNAAWSVSVEEKPWEKSQPDQTPWRKKGTCSGCLSSLFLDLVTA